MLGILNLISRAGREFGPEAIRFLMLVGRQLGVATEMCHLLELEEAYRVMARALVASGEARHPYTHHYSERVTQYALDIAVQMGCSEEDREVLEIAAVLHDIGKIGVESNILNKVEPLTPSEWTS